MARVVGNTEITPFLAVLRLLLIGGDATAILEQKPRRHFYYLMKTILRVNSERLTEHGHHWKMKKWSWFYSPLWSSHSCSWDRPPSCCAFCFLQREDMH